MSSMRGPRWRRPFRDLTTADIEQMGRNAFDMDEARWNAEQEAGDAYRDELQEHEIRELEMDGDNE